MRKEFRHRKGHASGQSTGGFLLLFAKCCAMSDTVEFLFGIVLGRNGIQKPDKKSAVQGLNLSGFGQMFPNGELSTMPSGRACNDRSRSSMSGSELPAGVVSTELSAVNNTCLADF